MKYFVELKPQEVLHSNEIFLQAHGEESLFFHLTP
jgi:hypothetical protein